MDRWFFQHNGESSGPLEFAVLGKFVAKGLVGPSTLVKKGEDGPWVQAQSIEALSGLLSDQIHRLKTPTSPTGSAHAIPNETRGVDLMQPTSPFAAPTVGAVSNSVRKGNEQGGNDSSSLAPYRPPATLSDHLANGCLSAIAAVFVTFLALVAIRGVAGPQLAHRLFGHFALIWFVLFVLVWLGQLLRRK